MDHRPKVIHEKYKYKGNTSKLQYENNFFCVFVIWTTPQNTDNKNQDRQTLFHQTKKL